ncbi:MAG TPA: monovalent cation/H(+) antiporter subunit G [Actinomycetota bacterium]|nr:monovalent cation/H(+) antiporter subunit G [Actinomycetota bacterium]
MSAADLAVAALLALGIAVTWLSCLGVLLMRDPYDRLHYTAPAAALAPVLIAAAVVVEEGLSAAGIKAVLIALVLVGTNPVLGHATARAARIREHGQWTVTEQEREGGRP